MTLLLYAVASKHMYIYVSHLHIYIQVYTVLSRYVYTQKLNKLILLYVKIYERWEMVNTDDHILLMGAPRRHSKLFHLTYKYVWYTKSYWIIADICIYVNLNIEEFRKVRCIALRRFWPEIALTYTIIFLKQRYCWWQSDMP